MEEGTLAKWHVKVGDTVRSGDVIAEIETDKATMEVEAVDEGVVEAILVPEGTEEVKVNTPIARLKGEGERGQLACPVRGRSRSAARRASGGARLAPAADRRRPPAAPAPELAAAPSPPAATPQGEATRSGRPRLRLAAGAPDRRSRRASTCSPVQGLRPARPDHPARRRGRWQGRAAGRCAAAAAPAGRDRRRQAPRQARSLEQMGIAPGSYDLDPAGRHEARPSRGG